MTHLEHAEYSLKRTHNKEPLAEILFQLIAHIKQQDEFIARLQKAVEYLEKLVDRHEGENSLNRPLI